MNKKIGKIITTFLALTVGLCTISGCKEEEQSAREEVKQKERKEQCHELSVKETGNYLVKNGKSEYTIVFPENSSSHLTDTAVDEMVYFFKEATGVTLGSKPDSDLQFNANNKYISIGETTLLSQANVSLDKTELGTSGYEIQTVGNSVFITGGAYGELYGVYGFLEIYFDLEVYAGDEIYLKSGISEQKFLDITAKDIPDIEHQIHPFSSQQTTTNRLRFKNVGDVYAANRGRVWHNVLKGVIPYELYGIDITADADPYGNVITQNMKDAITSHEMYESNPEWFNHPEWYVMEKEKTQDPLGDSSKIEPLQVNVTISQEGWSAEQNAESQQLFYEVVLYEMKAALNKSTSREMTFTLQDNGYSSEDAISMQNFAKYGTHAAEYIQCANYLAAEIRKEYPDFRMTIFAYSGVKNAPVKMNEKGEYVPIDDSVVLADNVDVMVCISSNRNFGIEDEEVNSEALKMAKQWEVLAKNSKLTCWLYNLTYYSNYFLPNSGMMSIANNYRYMFEHGYRLIYDQAQYTETALMDWGFLKSYLVSQLRWNVYQDVNELTENFFTHYFKAAAEPMLEAFHMEQNRLTEVGMTMEDVTDLTIGSDNTKKEMLKEEAWSDNFLQQLLAKFDEAYKAIEIYKDSDPTLYQTLYNRINLETFSIRYLRIEIYGKYYGELKNEWLVALGKDVKNMGITRFGELVSLEWYFGDIF